MKGTCSRFFVRLVVALAFGACAFAPQLTHAAFLDVAVSGQVVNEGAQSQVTLTLTRDANDFGLCTVVGTIVTVDDTAVAGSDYTALSAPFSLTIDVNDTQAGQQFVVDTLNDGLFEAGDQFSIVVNEDTAGCPFPVQDNTPVAVPIVEGSPLPASIGFAQTVVDVDETAGTVTLQVDLVGTQTIQGSFIVPATVTTNAGTAQDGIDYQGLGSGVFLPDFTEALLSQTVVIAILDDGNVEAGETFAVALSAPDMTFPDDTSAPLPQAPAATVTILDDDGPGTLQLSAGTYQIGEADPAGGITVSATRTGGRRGPASVDFVVTAGTATAGTDFTPVSGTLAWADADAAAKTIVVAVTNDALVDPNETVAITLANAVGSTLGAPAGATLTIVDDDSPPSGGGDENLTTPAGSTASVTFAVTGAPPFTLAASTGTVTPATLTAPGNATYTLAIDPATQAGATINDVISITDAGGNVVTKQVAIQVTVAVARDIAVIPTLTPNQQEVAMLFDDMCPRLGSLGALNQDQADLLDVCVGLRDPATTDAQVVEALDQLSAQELITAATTTLRLAGLQQGNLTDRINTIRSGARGFDVSGLNLDIGGQMVNGAVLAEVADETIGRLADALFGGGASADEFARWGLFLNGKISYGDKDETEREAGFGLDTIGLTGGVDYRFDRNVVLGLAVGYAAVDSDFDGHRGGLDIESWSASLFGTYFVADKLYVDAMATIGRNDYDSVRHITFTDASGLTAETATGETDGMQFSGGVASGFDFNRGKWTFGPHAGFYYVGVATDGFSESGAGGLDLVIGDQDATSFTLNGGGHLSFAYTAPWGVLVPHLRLDYVHEFEDGRETVNLRLAADPFNTDPSNPTPVIALQTDTPDPDYFVWSAGLSAQFINGISGFVSYRSMAGFEDFSLGELTYGLRMEKSF